MKIEEMRKKLIEFCDKNKCYADCPLSGDVCKCGRGYSFETKPHEYGYMTDVEIEAAYKIAFPKAESAAPRIKDSGERTTFSTGAVRDMHTGKGRMDLLPWEAIVEVSKHCEDGALKYGEHNVDKGIPIHSLVDSAFRHLAKYTMGETDEPHLRAAAWNLLWALYMEAKHPELQDLPARLGGSKCEE